MSIATAFDPPDPASLGTPAAQSVQCALFMRLKKTYGNRAGDVGWLLVRLGQPEHRDYEAALESCFRRTVPELTTLSSAVASARTKARTDQTRELLDAIEAALLTARGVASKRPA